MKKKFLFVCLAFASFLNAQEKRALLIGIDKYTPPEGYIAGTGSRSMFSDLQGCVNDAKSIYSIISSRFQFNPQLIDTLFNEAASREGIINQLNALLTKSNSGDVAFFYYAGHGSQVKNSLSNEDDKKDESMVPSDTWRAGVKDIRDKELSAIFNKFIDKGINLTVIMDCCHSGSITRGPNEQGKFRFISEPNYDARDASVVIPPERRKDGKFLIISASQDNEFAQEQYDESNTPHGAFTIALMQALQQQSLDASTSNLFTATRAILKSNGKKQEPVLGGSAQRQQETLFGLQKGSVPDRLVVAVQKIENNKIVLQGGMALGLSKNNELVKFNGKDTLVKISIDTVINITNSIASAKKGNIKDLKPGDLLEVTNWTSSSAPLLKVYIPKNSFSYNDILLFSKMSASIRNSKSVKWMSSLAQGDPYSTVFYNNGKWMANVDGVPLKQELALNAPSLLKLGKKDSTFYFELPPFAKLGDSLTNRLKQNRTIKVVDNIADAHYVLYGTINDAGQPSYGLRRLQISAKDSLENMLLVTPAHALAEESEKDINELVEGLYEQAMKLGKIRGWLQLTGPKSSESNFPFHLEMINSATGKKVANNTFLIGEKVELSLLADKGYKALGSIPLKYVYVFGIDKEGSMQLMYPLDSDGNVENKYPKWDDGKMIQTVSLAKLNIQDPTGTDTFFLLASKDPIQNYGMLFNQTGIRAVTRNINADPNPLGDLLTLGSENTRSASLVVPATWSLQKMLIKTKYK